MMIKHSSSTATDARRGVTLTEVLMSMLIMSIGVTFVAGIFPIAVLRSIQASQLTSATILRHQAVTMMEMQPGLVHDPDGDGDVVEHFRGPDWTVALPETRNYIVDPWGFFIHVQDGDGLHNWFGNVNNDPVDGNPAPERYRALRRYDGGIAALNPGRPLQYHEQLAATLTASPDRWEEHVNTTPIGVNAEWVDLPVTTDLTTLIDPQASPTAGILPDPEASRIIVFHGDGRGSQSYPITHITGNRVWWSENCPGGKDLNVNGSVDARALPPYFRDTNGNWDVSHVVLESSQARLFSWMLSVRKRPDGNATADCVVMFNRGIEPKNEQVYPATFVRGTHTVVVQRPANTPEPFLKKGGYVLDVVTARWYRIQDFRVRRTTDLTWVHPAYDIVLTTEHTILEAGGEDYLNFDGAGPDAEDDPNGDGIVDPGDDLNGNGILDREDLNGNGRLDMGGAIFLPGVIEVFPLGNKNLPEALR